jgi:hydrogenase maturation protease
MQPEGLNALRLEDFNIITFRAVRMAGTTRRLRILVMGVGNALMQDDGVGSSVIQRLTESPEPEPGLELIDGGTIGLSLLPQLEDADAVIVVDAAELNAPPGAVRVFLDGEIDRQLSGKRRTVHEVALLDLFSAAAIRGRMPARRALVAVQPACTEWGLDLTADVAAAVPGACETIRALAAAWSTGAEAA